MKITTDEANIFIKNFFDKNPDKDYWDCTNAIKDNFDMDFETAFKHMVNYLTRRRDEV